jgi:hypothetical protein
MRGDAKSILIAPDRTEDTRISQRHRYPRLLMHISQKQHWFNRDQRSAGASASTIQLVAPKLIRQRKCLPVGDLERDRPGPLGSPSQPNQSAAPRVGDAPNPLSHAFLVCRPGQPTRIGPHNPPCRDRQRAYWIAQSIAESRRASGVQRTADCP